MIPVSNVFLTKGLGKMNDGTKWLFMVENPFAQGEVYQCENDSHP